MKQEEIVQRIESELRNREKTIVNRNAFAALFGAISDPLGALGKIFLGRQDALDAEKQRLAQDAMLELLCRIDEAITAADVKARSAGVTISGLIETTATNSEHVVGARIGPKSGSVEFKPGTQIKTTAYGAKTVTGLEIR